MGHDISVDIVGTGNQFLFSAMPGSATIDDLDPTDSFDFSENTFDSWQNLMSHTSQIGVDTQISVSPTDTVLLKNTDLSSLTASQFHFV